MSRGRRVEGRGAGRAVLALMLLAVAVPVAAQSPVAQSPVALRSAVLHGEGVPGSGLAQSEPHALPLDTTLADPWLGRDKALHAAGSFLLTLSAQYVLTAKLGTGEGTALPLAAGAAFSLGLAKEVADSRRPVSPLFSRRDLVADAVGVALAVGLVLL